MTRKLSRFGIVLIVLYIILTIWMSLPCKGGVDLAPAPCFLNIVVPYFPWDIIFFDYFFFNPYGGMFFTLAFIINATILYFIGHGIDRLQNHRKAK